jgi:DNA-binding transcriptional ArsR family regulator
MAEAMSVFATESRVRLLYALLDRQRSVDELADAVEMDPSAVSQQLRVLRQLRFVVAEREGRRMRYRLHDDHVAELLAAVRHHHEHASRGWSAAAAPQGRARSSASGQPEARNVADPVVLPIAHIEHWIWQLLYLAPILAIAGALIVAQIMDRRDPGRYERGAEERAERALDEILSP